MATVNKRPSGKWQATVRKDGTSQSQSFRKHADAVKWAREAELQAERGHLKHAPMLAADIMSLGDVLVKYRETVTSLKRCADNERYAINGLLRNCAALTKTRIDKLTPADFVAHRDRRLKQMKPATVVRELGWIQHAIDIACSDWGQRINDGNLLLNWLLSGRYLSSL